MKTIFSKVFFMTPKYYDLYSCAASMGAFYYIFFIMPLSVIDDSAISEVADHHLHDLERRDYVVYHIP